MSDLDPEEVRRAKELAAGPLGDQLAKYPLRFATSVLIAPTRRSRLFKPVNGTITLLRLNERPLGVTCAHVLDGFRSRPASDEPGFWIGSLEVDLSERVISEDSYLDLAVLDLSGLDLSKINSGGEIGAAFFTPVQWPPQIPTKGDWVSFGGFPGNWRDHPAIDEVVFRSFSVGLSEVTATGNDYIACQFERDHWVSPRGNKGFDLYELGGMSGGPAFIWRELTAEFFGIIGEYSATMDLLYIRLAHFIEEDGSIRRRYLGAR